MVLAVKPRVRERLRAEGITQLAALFHVPVPHGAQGLKSEPKLLQRTPVLRESPRVSHAH